jgi:hypothetical protein
MLYKNPEKYRISIGIDVICLSAVGVFLNSKYQLRKEHCNLIV